MDLINKILLQEENFFNPKRVDQREEQKKEEERKLLQQRKEDAIKYHAESFLSQTAKFSELIKNQLEDYNKNFSKLLKIVLEKIKKYQFIVANVTLDNTSWGGATITFNIFYPNKDVFYEFQSFVSTLNLSKNVKIWTQHLFTGNMGEIFLVLDNFLTSYRD